MAVVIDAGSPDNLSLNARQVKAIAENIEHYDERSRNLSKAVTSDLASTDKGEYFTAKTHQRTGPRAVARADRYTDQDNKRLKKGERQAPYEDFDDSIEEAAFEQVEKMINATDEGNIAMGEGKNNHRDSFILNRMFASMMEAVDDDADAYGVRHTFQTVAFPATQIVPVDYAAYHKGKSDGEAAPSAADQGLTKSKLFGGLERLEKARFRGPINLAGSQRDILNLATSLQLTSQDFVDQKLLAQITDILAQEHKMFMGINFWDIHPDNMVGHGTNAGEVAMFTQRSVMYREKQVVSLKYDRLPTRRYNHQLYYAIASGFLRRDDLSVAKILVNHTATPV